MHVTAEEIGNQIRIYAQNFLATEYGTTALKRLKTLNVIALDAYDNGGTSQATDNQIQIAARRDIKAGKLTATTKLVVRHELGHLLDATAPDYPDFNERFTHEKIAWANAKPKTAAENWYKSVSLLTHLDPLRMQALGFPRPETKISSAQLMRGVAVERGRMERDCVFVDEGFAERLAMAHLVDDPNYYGLP